MTHILDFEKEIVELEGTIADLKRSSEKYGVDFQSNITFLTEKCEHKKKEIYSRLNAWKTVQVARHAQRPMIQDLLPLIFSEFIELHGDRRIGDDRALIGGFAKISDILVMLIGNNKGKNLNENMEQNFGMTGPEGFRKALRLMRLAEEPLCGAHRDHRLTAQQIKATLLENIRDLKKKSMTALLQKRYDKYSSLGVFTMVKTSVLLFKPPVSRQ